MKALLLSAQRPFLWSWVAGSMGVFAGVGAAFGQGAETLGERVAAARASAQGAREAQDSATRHFKLREAADLGMAALKAFPETHWDRPQLERFVKDIGYQWVSKLPRADQEAWLATHSSTARSSSAHLVVGFIEWRMGRRTMALARAAHLLSIAPDSYGAGVAMLGVMAVHYHRSDLPACASALKAFINVAPNNRFTASALCSYTWGICRRDKPQEAHKLID